MALAFPAEVQGQQGGDVRAGGLRVFLDCQSRNCNRDFFRTEIQFVNWVRDRQDGQLHVIMTSEQNGSGGQAYRFDFIGTEDLEGAEDQLTHNSSQTDTRDEVLTALTRTLSIGLARFAQLAGLADGLSVRAPARPEAAEEPVGGVQVDDPWNFWVFRLGARGSTSGEASRNNQNVFGNMSANRTTEEWKFELAGSGSYRRSETELSDSTRFVNESRNWNVRSLLVNSIADQWSLGVSTRANSSTFSNQDFGVSVAPALEYSLFPYEEATRRQLVAFYELGMRYFDYEEETVFGKTTQTVLEESLTLSYRARQPWGEAEAAISGSHYFHDLGLWELSLNGDIEFRVVRGLSVSLDGGVSWIRNQIFLTPPEDVSDEERLVQRRQLPTDYDYFVSVGFSYSFGSIFNNVVNNRFRGRRFF